MKRLIKNHVMSSVDNNNANTCEKSNVTANKISNILKYLNQFNDVKLNTTSNGDLTLIADGIRYQIL